MAVVNSPVKTGTSRPTSGDYPYQLWMGTDGAISIWTGSAWVSSVGSGGATVDIGAKLGLPSNRYRLKSVKIENSTVVANSTLTICDLTAQSGTMISFWLADKGNGPYRDGVVRIYVDGEVSPSITFDVGILGGHFTPTNGTFNASVMHMSASEDQASKSAHITFKYPVPFATELKITFENLVGAAASATIYAHVVYTNDATDTRRLKCTDVTYVGKTTVNDGSDATILNVTAAGVLVFNSMLVEGAASNTPNERNLQFTVDGSLDIEPPGTEDWFFGGWSDISGQYSTPWYAITRAVSNNRIRMVDLLAAYGGIPFTTSISCVWKDEAAVTANANIAYLWLWYQDP